MSRTPIIRSDDLRGENRHRILVALRRESTLSHAALGQDTGLSRAAISMLIAQLAAEGVLAIACGGGCGAPGRGRRGRPRASVALRAEAASVLTAALTIDRLRVALVDYAGRERASETLRLDTRALAREALLGTIGDALEALARRAPRGVVAQVGLGVQGITANGSGELLWSPIVGVGEVPLGEALERRLGVPVSVNNDCTAIARALERCAGDALGANFATVLFGHGIGMALTLDGRAVSGTRSSALELGHLRFERDGALCRCGLRGCIEAYAADYGIARGATSDLAPDAPPPGRVAAETITRLAARAALGEPLARAAFELAGRAVGEGLATLFTLLDPMPVALVGRDESTFAPMREALLAALAARARAELAPRPALHLFADAESLLHAGLALDALDALDRRIAAQDAEPRGERSTA